MASQVRCAFMLILVQEIKKTWRPRGCLYDSLACPPLALSVHRHAFPFNIIRWENDFICIAGETETNRKPRGSVLLGGLQGNPTNCKTFKACQPETSPDCHVMRTFKQHYGKVHVVRNWGLQPIAMCVCHLRSWSSNSSQAFETLAAPANILTLLWLLVRDPKPEPSIQTAISDSWPQKGCEIRNVYFKLLRFRVISYTARDK